MTDFIKIYYYATSVNCFIAFFVNMLLIYLILRHSRQEFGRYKYLLLTFAMFNITYASVIVLGAPVSYLSDQSWIIFTHGVIADTSYSYMGGAVYCTFSLLWMSLVFIHFVYRYVVVCRKEWTAIIESSLWAKILVAFLFIVLCVYSTICGQYFCTREVMSKKLAESIKENYHIAEPEKLGYILLRATKLDGSISWGGTTSIIDHIVFSYVLFGIILVLGYRTWKTIQQLHRIGHTSRTVQIQRQLFIALSFQTLTPFCLWQLPAMINITFPLWDPDFTLGPMTILFCYLTSVNKVVDPIITMMCIGNYRRALFAMFKRNISKIRQIRSSQMQTTTPVDTMFTQSVTATVIPE